MCPRQQVWRRWRTFSTISAEVHSWHCQVDEKLVERPPRYWAPARREPAMLDIKNGRQLQLDKTRSRFPRTGRRQQVVREPRASQRVFLCAMLFRATYAIHRIRHGIRQTAVRAGRRPCPSVPNGRLRHMLIGYAVSTGRHSRLTGGRLPVAGPVARRAAGRGRRRRPRLRRLRVRRPRRGSTAACARSGRAT